MSEDLREYSRLLERVLARFPGLSREELEAMVEAKLRESKLLNRVGALLLVAEELGAFKEREDVGEIKSYAKIGGLVPGLRDVSIRGVVYAMAGPVEAGGHKILRLKMGDETGSVNVIIWDEKVEEVNALGLKLGDQIAVLHGYTRERVETGRPELHVGAGGVVAKLGEGIKDPRSFYLDLGEALEAGDGVYDVKAIVLDVGEERQVSTRYGEATLRELRLVGESGEARLTIWRDRIGEFGNLEVGEAIYVTDLRIEGSRAALTPRSILAIREKPTEETLRMIQERKVRELILRVLDVVEKRAGVVAIATDGREVVRVQPCPSGVKPGDHLLVRDAVREVRRGRVRLLCFGSGVERIEPAQPIEPPNRAVKLSEVVSSRDTELTDVIVEGILYTKTQPFKVRTRFGEVDKVGFWIRDRDTAVQGSAWRSKAMEIAGIEEGSRIRLKWVSIRMNVFNEPEIQLDEDSIIEVLEKPGQEEKIEE
ncbi:MAG: OB-fold nucleic acid binding domain-containing protein [Aigarchaeota archaeon]|nr:OB-fold nucleic acid binding domain-containing protein [Candidatus Wolframiiraptor gerlachensis]